MLLYAIEIHVVCELGRKIVSLTLATLTLVAGRLPGESGGLPDHTQIAPLLS